MPITLNLDEVEGTEGDIGPYDGTVMRYATAYNVPLPLTKPASFGILVDALTALGLPAFFEPHPDPRLGGYAMTRYRPRAVNADTIRIGMLYTSGGPFTTVEQLRFRDSATLSSAPTQLLSNGDPLYVQYMAAGKLIKKNLTINSMLTIRHFSVAKTFIEPEAVGIMDLFGGVNDRAWHDLPAGYWLFSGVEASSQDGGEHVDLECTFSTKQREDWQTIGYMEDDHGKPVFVNPTVVHDLRNTPYGYGQINSNGVTLVGDFLMYDFFSFFGIT